MFDTAADSELGNLIRAYIVIVENMNYGTKNLSNATDDALEERLTKKALETK
jgi:hypothetical protein